MTETTEKTSQLLQSQSAPNLLSNSTLTSVNQESDVSVELDVSDKKIKKDIMQILSFYDTMNDFAELIMQDANDNKKKYSEINTYKILHNYYLNKLQGNLYKDANFITNENTNKTYNFNNHEYNIKFDGKDQKKEFLNWVLSLINPTSKNNDEFRKDVKDNLKIVLQKIGEIITDLNINIQSILNNIDNDKINYFIERLHLYNLQKEINADAINETNIKLLVTYFIKKYFITIPSDYIISKVSDGIKELKINIANTNNLTLDYTFPITYFDDTRSDQININDCFMFRIFSQDKEIYDNTNIIKPYKYTPKITENNNYITVKTTKENNTETNFLAFLKKDISFNIFNVNYSYTEYGIKCKDTDNNILIIKNNIIGKKIKCKDKEKADYGIYQIIKIIANLKNYNELDKYVNNTNEKNIFILSEGKIQINDNSILSLSDGGDDNNLKALLNPKDDNKNDINFKKLQETFIIFLFGARRASDWIQQHLAKELFFYLQTTDITCKIYGLLIGAPVFFTNEISNDEKNILCNSKEITFYNINSNKINTDNNENYQIIDIMSNINNNNNIQYKMNYKNIDSPNSLIVNTTSFEMPHSRLFYNKYLKYKQKYFELKNEI